jgi:hypothetical protein
MALLWVNGVYAQERPRLLRATENAPERSWTLRLGSGNPAAPPSTGAPAYLPAEDPSVTEADTDAVFEEEIPRADLEPGGAGRVRNGSTPATAEAATGGIEPANPVDLLDEDRNEAAERENRRTEALEALERRAEEEPYGALGLRIGTFILKPSLDQGLTYTSNADLEPDGATALLSETMLRLNATSDWSRHSLELNAFGTLRRSLSGAETHDREGGLDGRLNLDIGPDLRGFAALAYAVQPESASSPVELPANVISQPLRHAFSGSLGLSKDVGKLRFGLSGALERLVYADAELEGGGELSQRDRNTTLLTVALRGGYEISPALTPFVETELGRRIFDEAIDGSGYARSATRYGARAGLAFTRSEKLTGEISAGWIHEDSDDERLEAISGPAVNASLVWSPRRGTEIGLAGSTVVETTTAAGESGSLLYAASLTVDRDIRANLTLNALAAFSWRDYVGSSDADRTWVAEAGLTYWMNRYAGVTGRLRHEALSSTLPDRDADATSIHLGLKLQR